MLHLQDARLFARVAATGSFSEAARQLDLTPAAVSATLKKLEALLSARLLERSTRSLRLTAEGTQFLDTCERLLAVWAEGEAQRRGRPAGRGAARGAERSGAGLAHALAARVRARAPAGAGGAARERHGAGTAARGLDLALRYGALADSSLAARRLCANPRVLVASPEYVREHGMPQSPADLERHPCLTYFLKGRRHAQWRFSRAGRVVQVKVDGPLATSNGTMVRQWALAGEGIAYKSRIDVLPDLRAGRLVPLLADWTPEEVPLHAVLLSHKRVPQRVRALLDFLAARFAALEDDEGI